MRLPFRVPLLLRLPGLIVLPAALLVLAAPRGLAAGAPVALPDSLGPVEAAPTAGTPNPLRPYISRRTLTAAETDAPLTFEVALKMRNFDELQARVARGELIPRAEMAAKYFPAPADYATVRQWLAGLGLTITREDDNHLALFAQGRVRDVQAALGATFARVSFRGAEYTSAITAPSVPAGVSPLIVGINGLQQHLVLRGHLVLRPNSLTGTNPPYLPGQIAQAYGAQSLYNAGVTGTGQTIAIAINAFPSTSDLASFWSTCGISQSINNVSFIQVVSGALPAPSGEETLDTEWASSIAPGAHLRVYAVPTLTTSNLDAIYQQIFNDATGNPGVAIHQLSMSYGIGETFEPSSQLQTDSQFFAMLAGAGITPIASSGDAGATPDSTGHGGGGPEQVENPASDPSVTGVGGTSLLLNSSGAPSSEVVWNNSSGASGGGPSRHFSRPSWQTGTGVSGSMREVPDVASAADPSNGGFLILNGSEFSTGGTSWSAPTWAGFNALLNQSRSKAGLSAIGALAPNLYVLIGTANFRDITSGNNAFQNTVGFSAGTGYDPATGIGVPNVATLVATLSPGSTRAPTFTDGPPPSSSLAGTSYSFTYTAGGSPAPTFSVTSGELPPGLALSSSGVISGTTPLTGFFSGTVTAGNSAGSAQQTFTITVGTVPSFSSTPLTASIPDESAFSFAFVASGFPAPTFAVTSGSLPPGLTLQPNGTVTGSPTASGTFSGTITASNGFGNAVTQSFTITVGPPATDTPTMPPWSLAALGALLAAAALRTRARAEARG